MKKRNEPTVVAKAIQTVAGFEKVYQLLQQQVTLKGQSRSTLENYIRRIALKSFHLGKLPDQLCNDEMNEYLTSLALLPHLLHEAVLNTPFTGCGITFG